MWFTSISKQGAFEEEQVIKSSISKYEETSSFEKERAILLVDLAIF